MSSPLSVDVVLSFEFPGMTEIALQRHLGFARIELEKAVQNRDQFVQGHRDHVSRLERDLALRSSDEFMSLVAELRVMIRSAGKTPKQTKDILAQKPPADDSHAPIRDVWADILKMSKELTREAS